MRLRTTDEIRDRMRAARLRADALPELSELPWPEVDYLLWDGRRKTVAYLATEVDGELHVIALRKPDRNDGGIHAELCSLCLTLQPPRAVATWTHPMRDASGRYRSMGIRACRQLECGEYVTGRRTLPLVTLGERLSVDERRARLRRNLELFVRRALHDRSASGSPR